MTLVLLKEKSHSPVRNSPLKSANSSQNYYKVADFAQHHLFISIKDLPQFPLTSHQAPHNPPLDF